MLPIEGLDGIEQAFESSLVRIVISNSPKSWHLSLTAIHATSDSFSLAGPHDNRSVLMAMQDCENHGSFKFLAMQNCILIR